MARSTTHLLRYQAFIVLAVAACTGVWNSLISKHIPDPYLDEVFHVQQAQVYCSGDFQTWDPKITTPPGLYLISYVVFRLIGRCDIDVLRLTNASILCLVALQLYFILLDSSPNDEGIDTLKSKNDPDLTSKTGWNTSHTALNVCLFPPLFFFSGLYYTDMGSLLFDLMTAHICMQQLRQTSFSVGFAVLQLLTAVVALFFRQTNIFWVGVFPIGLTVLRASYHLRLESDDNRVLEEEFWLEDYLHAGVDLIVAGIVKIDTIFLDILQYIVVLLGFVAFVFWNGGVVLGDKSNHIATLHLPQMLYIWPYILFFSFPVIIAAIGPPMIALTTSGYEAAATRIPRIWLLVALSGLAAVVIHHNTIIHPFTLADNRHYVFYVFRLLRRHWSLKYVAAPVYVLCGWLGVRAMTAISPYPNPPQKINIGRQFDLERRQRIGFALVWAATTALSLITAPLVEPRYFIVPWVMWRLQVHVSSAKALWAETAWHCIINLATGYMFLFKWFVWEQEPGQRQRFMW